ncbi:MAG: transcriptional repressor LexA [Planctomycetota bacterium]
MTRRPRLPAGRTRERIFSFVRDSLERGTPPTLREIQSAVGLRAVESVREQLTRLVDEGRLIKEEGVARGWRLPPGEVSDTHYVPILGRVPAGGLSESIEEREGVLPVDRRRVRGASDKLFALRVHGESMRDAGILPGDFVIVDPKAQARARDIVVARIDGEATVKRLAIVKGKPELWPENPSFQPIVPAPGEELEIVGRVIEVRRYLSA